MKDPRYKSDFKRFSYINRCLKGKEILDMGSKEGYLHELFLKNNPDKKIYSCDLKDSDFNFDFNKSFKIKKKFDTIVAGEIIEHLENPTYFIKECKKILNEQGRLIITTPNSIGIQYIKNPEWTVNQERGHINSFTMPMIKKILTNNSFKIIYSDYINAFWINNPLQIISFIIKRLRPDLIVVADS